MARKVQELTCTFYVGGKQVDKLSPEHLDKMSQRLGEVMSFYYTANIEEYRKINKSKTGVN